VAEDVTGPVTGSRASDDGAIEIDKETIGALVEIDVPRDRAPSSERLNRHLQPGRHHHEPRPAPREADAIPLRTESTDTYCLAGRPVDWAAEAQGFVFQRDGLSC
jgi:hypothetical protein